MSYAEIGRRVRALRLERNMTQARLGKVLGTTQTAVSEVERGNRGLTVQQLVKLSRALGASPDEILGTGNGSRDEGRPRDARLLRRLRQVEGLPEAQLQAVLKLLDGVLEVHAERR